MPPLNKMHQHKRLTVRYIKQLNNERMQPSTHQVRIRHEKKSHRRKKTGCRLFWGVVALQLFHVWFGSSLYGSKSKYSMRNVKSCHTQRSISLLKLLASVTGQNNGAQAMQRFKKLHSVPTARHSLTNKTFLFRLQIHRQDSSKFPLLQINLFRNWDS